jgi:hypothetical protein
MKRLLGVAFGVTMLLAVSVVPAYADTTGGGNQFSTGTETCTTSGGKTTCTDTSVSAQQDGSSYDVCADVFKYSISRRGDFTVISETYGCAIGVSTVTIGTDLSASIAPTDVPLQTCTNKSCTDAGTVTVAADGTPTSAIQTTSGRITTTDGSCTTRTSFTDKSVDVAGSMTFGSTTTSTTGFVSTHSETSKTTCK